MTTTSTIPALPAATALAGTEPFETVQGGASVRATSVQIVASLSTSTSSGLVTRTSAITSLSTSTSSGLSTATSSITSLSTSTSTGIAGAGLTSAAITAAPAASALDGTELTPGSQGATLVKYTGQQLMTLITGSTTLSGATVTTSKPLLNLAQTWNAGGVTFTGLKLNVTDTASAAASLLLDLQVASVTKFKVVKDGTIQVGPGTNGTHSVALGFNGAGIYGDTSGRVGIVPNGTGYGVALISSSAFNLDRDITLGWASSNNFGGNPDVALSRISANLLGLGTGAAASFAGSLKLTDLFTNNAAFLIRTNTALTSSAGAQAATILNGPTAGNPTKWVAVDDNGTTRYVPLW